MTSKQLLPIPETYAFSKLMCDYVGGDENPRPFFHRYPSVENFKAQLEEKGKSFTKEDRKRLVKQLREQYRCCEASNATLENIESLNDPNTFTITTGHQLNLFTGPLYFLYKIFSTINLCESLKQSYPDYRFVPVYWMATEDHDFEEINYFNFQGKKVQWDRESGGPVGRLSLDGLKEVYQSLESEWGKSENALELLRLFQEAYLEHENLADATRYLANKVFQKQGLVIIDGDDAQLKTAFSSIVERELAGGDSHREITETTKRLEKAGYSQQVFPREINLFYIEEGLRERIIERHHKYYLSDSDKVFEKEEIMQILENHPERFSPNALLRPLYQEMILPNLCYIGGGGELAYWFQLKDYFESVQIPFPMLLLRNSVLLVPNKLKLKLDKMEVPLEKLFLQPHELKAWYTKKISEIPIDFSKQKSFLQEQFKELYTLAEKTDASFLGAVAAQEKKQLNGLDHLEKRLLKAQKRKLSDVLERLSAIQRELFPNGSLQERTHNFSEWYLEYGEELLKVLKRNLNPLDPEFTLVVLD